MGMLPRARRAAGERFTVCMELVDVERDDRGRLVVLAGFPHPTNDWGWSSWESDGEYLDDSGWNRPWDRSVYLSQITVEPGELGLTVNDVEWEADHARVLVQDGSAWTKVDLPFPCRRFRRLPGLGLCAVGRYGLAVSRGDRWEALELAPEGRPVPCALVDAVAAGDRIVGINRDGGGGIGWIDVERESLRWTPLTDSRLDGMYVGLPVGDRALAAGNPGIFSVTGGELERLVRGQRRGFRTMTGDADCAYAGTTSGDIVAIPTGGRARTFGLRFSRAPSIALFGGRVFASAGRDVRAVSPEGRAENVEIPMPGRGEVRMRALGDELYAVCSHHLAVGDGDRWRLIKFR